MNEIQKFLRKLNKKEKAFLIKQLLPQIMDNNLTGLDVKKLEGKINLYRVRAGRIRIIFSQNGSKNIILKIAFYKDVYK